MAAHARGSWLANEVDVVAALRLHVRSACRAAVTPTCDIVMRIFERLINERNVDGSDVSMTAWSFDYLGD